MPSSLLPSAMVPHAPVHGTLISEGKTLAYEIFGDRSLRTPVFYLHGVPGNRMEAVLAHVPALKKGVSLIAVDRPGFGLSGFREARAILDTPKHVETIADHLGLERFGVIGVSGGGPHAAACALTLEPRLAAASLVSSLAPFDEFTHPLLSKLLPWLRFLTAGPKIIGGAVAALAKRKLKKSADAILRDLDGERPAADVALLRNPEVAAMFRRNLDMIDECEEGIIHELSILSSPWGFRVADIAAPVHVWHGKADPTVPFSMGKHLAMTIPRAKRHFVGGLGHFLILHRLPHILEVMRREFELRARALRAVPA